MTDLLLTVRMVTVECCVAGCHVVFAMPKDLNEEYRSNHKSWFCPRGHSQYYIGKTEEQRLKEENQRLQDEVDRRRKMEKQWKKYSEHQERSAAAHKGHATRLRKKLAKGECPCCGQVFKNIRRHIHRIHPEFVKELESNG